MKKSSCQFQSKSSLNSSRRSSTYVGIGSLLVAHGFFPRIFSSEAERNVKSLVDTNATQQPNQH